MTRVGLLSIAVICSLVSTILSQQDLKCWSCNNQLLQFCDDPFDSSKLNAAEKLNIIECPNGRCVKTVANSPDGKSIDRLCAANQTEAERHCKMEGLTFCEFCATDECNGAAQYGPIALLIAIPVAIAKIFLF